MPNQFVQIVANPLHTRNDYGSINEIAGKCLPLLERNPRGDCLCVFNGQGGEYIIDIDKRDIQVIIDKPLNI